MQQNTYEQFETEEPNKNDLFRNLGEKRQRLFERLKKLQQSTFGTNSGSNDWLQELMTLGANFIIKILNLFLSLIGLELPTLGPSENKSLPTQTEPEISETLTVDTHDFDFTPKLKKSRPMAIKNFLRMRSLNLPVSEKILESITQSDLDILNTLSDQEARNLIGTETTRVLEDIQSMPRKRRQRDELSLIDESDFDATYAPMFSM